jgi:hypothetical protein
MCGDQSNQDIDVREAAALLGVNPDRLRSLAHVSWPVAAAEVEAWQAEPPDWLIEVCRREAAKAARSDGRAKRAKRDQRRDWRRQDAKKQRARWLALDCPAGHAFAVKGFGTEKSFDEYAFYAIKDPHGWCGRCSGEPVYSASDLAGLGLSKYRIGKLPEPDYYEPNPVDERYAPARLWTKSTLRQAGVELPGCRDDAARA